MSEAFVSALDILDKRAPGTPAQIRGLRDAVFSIRQRVKQALNQGLAPGEVESARSLLQAAEIAEDVVGRMVGKLAV
jgi:hypothetical protein